MARNFAGQPCIVAHHVVAIGCFYDHVDRQTERYGSSHNGGVSNRCLVNFCFGGDPFLVAKLVEAKLHPHFRHLDIDIGFDGIKNDAFDQGRVAHAADSKTGRTALEKHQFFHQEGKADQAQGIRIGWHEDFIAGENTALGGPQDVGRTVEEDKVVIGFDFRQLLMKEQVGGGFGVAFVIAFQIDQVEGGGHQVQAREEGFPRFLFHNILDDEVLDVGISGVEDGIDGASSADVYLVPPVQAHEPDAGIGLGVKIKEKNPKAFLGQTGCCVDNKGGFADPAFVI